MVVVGFVVRSCGVLVRGSGIKFKVWRSEKEGERGAKEGITHKYHIMLCSCLSLMSALFYFRLLNFMFLYHS